MANGKSKIQIETKKNHELFISNQAITDFKLTNVRTAVKLNVNQTTYEGLIWRSYRPLSVLTGRPIYPA
jgi:hypothetical protein